MIRLPLCSERWHCQNWQGGFAGCRYHDADTNVRTCIFISRVWCCSVRSCSLCAILFLSSSTYLFTVTVKPDLPVIIGTGGNAEISKEGLTHWVITEAHLQGILLRLTLQRERLQCPLPIQARAVSLLHQVLVVRLPRCGRSSHNLALPLQLCTTSPP